MHLTLAAETDDPAFAPQPLTVLDRRPLYQSLRNLALPVFQMLRQHRSTLSDAAEHAASQVLACEAEGLGCFRALWQRSLTARRIRCHGNYHLKQVLCTATDLVTIDFEGEAARPLFERRLKRPVLHDVAGMLRSFHYAAQIASAGAAPRGKARRAKRADPVAERTRAVEAVRQQHALRHLLQVVTMAANEVTNLEERIQICLDQVCAHTGWPVGHAYLTTGDATGTLLPSTLWSLADPQRFEVFRAVSERTPLTAGIGLPGRVLASGSPAWLLDVTKDANFPQAQLARDLGVRAEFAAPALVGEEVVAVLEFFAEEAHEPDEAYLAVVTKSVHTRLVHSRSDLCLLLGGDFLDRRGDVRLIVDL